MSFFWNLNKIANEDVNNVNPVQSVQPTNAPAMDLQTWQKNNYKIVTSIIDFVKRNLNTESQDLHSADVISYYSSDPNIWATFQQVSTALNPNEDFNTFVQRLKNGGGQPQADNELAFSDSENLSTDIKDTEFYMQKVLADWMTLIAQQKKDSDPNQPSLEASGIGEAVHNFLTGRYMGGVTKWIDFAFKNKLLPSSSAAFIKQFGVKNGVGQDINQWYGTTDDPYPALSKIRQMAEEQHPSLLKALEECARAIAANKLNTGLSLDKDIGDNGKSTGSMTEDTKSVNPVASLMDVKPLTPESLELGDQLANNFMEQNPQYIEALKVAKHPVTGEVMLPALVKFNIGTEEQLIESSIREAFVGKTYEKVQDQKTKEWVYTSNEEHNQWVEFFIDNPNLLPPNIKPTDTDAIQDNESKLFPVLGDPKYQNLLNEYMGNPADQIGPAFEYLQYLYETNRVSDKDKLNKRIAQYGDVQMFNKLSNLATSFLKRDFDASYVLKNDHTLTAARCYALMNEKVKAFSSRLQQLLNSNEMIPLTENLFVYRNKQNQIMVTKYVGRGNYSVDPTVDPACGPLSDRNIDKLSNLAKVGEWCPKGLKNLQALYPDALKREQKEEKMTPIEKEYKAATDAHQQKQQEQNASLPDDQRKKAEAEQDRLQGWRALLSQKLIQQISKSAQMSGQQLNSTDDMVNYLSQKVKSVLSKKGNKSRIARNPEQFLKNVLSGKPQFYDEAGDMSIIAKALTAPNNPVQVEDFWAIPPEYDSYNVKDFNKLNDTSARGAFRLYAPYFLHKKREAARRGMINDTYTDNALFFFLSLVSVPPSVSGSGASEQVFGKYLYDLVGKRPVSTTNSWEEVEKNLESAPDVDIYDKLRNVPFNQKKRFYPSNVHPSGIEQREEEMDRDQKVFRYKGKKIPMQAFLGDKTLEEYQQEYVSNLQKRTQDQTAEELTNRMDSGEDPVSIAKDFMKNKILKKTPNNPDINNEVEKAFNDEHGVYNKLVQRFNKQYDPEQFAKKYLENQISSSKYFKEQALKQKEKLQNVNPSTLTPQQKFDLFVPLSVKTDKSKLTGLLRKPVNLDMGELEQIAKSDIPERYNQKIMNNENIHNIAMDYIKERKNLDDKSALAFLQDKMNRFNKTKQKEEQPPVSLDEYAKHYMTEVLKFEANYRTKAKSALENYQGSPSNKEPFPKLSSTQVFTKIISQLNKAANIRSKISKYASSNYGRYVKLVDSIVDRAIEDLYNA